jgi:hypothetical protein
MIVSEYLLCCVCSTYSFILQFLHSSHRIRACCRAAHGARVEPARMACRPRKISLPTLISRTSCDRRCRVGWDRFSLALPLGRCLTFGIFLYNNFSRISPYLTCNEQKKIYYHFTGSPDSYQAVKKPFFIFIITYTKFEYVDCEVIRGSEIEVCNKLPGCRRF